MSQSKKKREMLESMGTAIDRYADADKGDDDNQEDIEKINKELQFNQVHNITGKSR